jgi:hypothetical protein
VRQIRLLGIEVQFAVNPAGAFAVFGAEQAEVTFHSVVLSCSVENSKGFDAHSNGHRHGSPEGGDDDPMAFL